VPVLAYGVDEAGGLKEVDNGSCPVDIVFNSENGLVEGLGAGTSHGYFSSAGTSRLGELASISRPISVALASTRCSVTTPRYALRTDAIWLRAFSVLGIEGFALEMPSAQEPFRAAQERCATSETAHL